MSSGVAYDSAAARAIAGALSAIIPASAYATSAEMAERGLRPLHGEPEPMLRVIRSHRRAALGEHVGYEKTGDVRRRAGSRRLPDKALIAAANAPGNRLTRAALWLSQRAGHRRAPTGNIGSYGLRHHRHRARFALVNQEAGRRRIPEDRQPRVPEALRAPRYRGERDRRDGGLCGRPRDALQRAGDQH